MKNKINYVILGILSAIGLFFAFGILTDLIPNPWFTRMIGKNSLDYVFLISSSSIVGAYIGVHFYKKNAAKKCNAATYSGGIGSFLAFGCPICNKLLVLLFGTAALMAYLEPYRPILGFGSVALAGGALYWRVKR